MIGFLVLVTLPLIAVPVTAILCAVGDHHLARKWGRKP